MSECFLLNPTDSLQWHDSSCSVAIYLKNLTNIIIYLAVTILVRFLQCDWTQEGHDRDVRWLSWTNRSTWVYACLCVLMRLCSFFPLHGGCPVVFALVSRRYQRFFLALSVQSGSVIFSSCSSSLSPVSMVTEASQTSLPRHSCRACGASTPTLRRRIQTLPGSPDHLQDRRRDRVRESEREESANLISDKNQKISHNSTNN